MRENCHRGLGGETEYREPVTDGRAACRGFRPTPGAAFSERRRAGDQRMPLTA